MKELSKNEVEAVYKTICDVMKGSAVEWTYCSPSPFLFEVRVPVQSGELVNDEETALKAFNRLFHAFGVLPKDESMAMGKAGSYCMTSVEDEDESYCALFNHPAAMQFREGDEEYQFTLKEILDAQAEEAAAQSPIAPQCPVSSRFSRLFSSAPLICWG